MIEEVKNYWNRSPCNINHSSKDLFSLEYFSQVSEKKYFIEPHILDFANFNECSNLDVLEIGCGIGTAAESFLASGAKYTGVDISEKSIEITRKRLNLRNFKNFKLFVANAENLSSEIPIKKYDLIYSFGVLHHTPNPQNAFSELQKFAKKGTKVKIMLYHRKSTKVIALYIKYALKNKFSVNKSVAMGSEAQSNCPITFTYSVRDVQRICESIGISLDYYKIEHIFPYQVKKYKKHIYEKRFYWKIIPNKIFKKIERKFGWHLLIEGKFK